MQGQQVATFIRASPIAAAALAKAARQLNITGTVLSGNATRFTSVIRMLESLQRLRSALVAAVDAEPSVFKPAVRQVIESRDFWDDLSALMPILQPFAAAITAIQSLDATLADVLLHWLRLAAAVQRSLPRLPQGKTYSTLHLCSLHCSLINAIGALVELMIILSRSVLQVSGIMWWASSTHDARRWTAHCITWLSSWTPATRQPSWPGASCLTWWKRSAIISTC